MSIINQMLQDLEQRRADDKPVTPALAEVRAVAAQTPKKPWLLLLSALTLLTLIAYLSLSPMAIKQFSLNKTPMFSEAQANNAAATAPKASTPVPRPTVNVQTATAPTPPAPELPANLETSQTGLSTSLSEDSIAHLKNIESKTANSKANQLIVNKEKNTEIAEKKESATPILLASNAQTQTNTAISDAVSTAPVQLAASTHQTISKKMSPAQKLLNDYKQAIQYLQMGRVAEAETLLSTILEIKPDHQDARQTLASLLLDSNRNSEAMSILKTGLTINPAQTEFRLALARLELELAGNEQALKTLAEGTPYAQNNAEYHSFYATLLQRNNQHQEAIEQYKKALASNPDMTNSLVGLGISLQTLSRLPEAKEAFERAQNNKLSPELAQFVAQRIKQIKQQLS